jgi:hypothetical protein
MAVGFHNVASLKVLKVTLYNYVTPNGELTKRGAAVEVWPMIVPVNCTGARH